VRAESREKGLAEALATEYAARIEALQEGM
jgi:hypothetical protein